MGPRVRVPLVPRFFCLQQVRLRPEGSFEDSTEVVHPNRHRLRPGNSTGVHHCQINDPHSGASRLHLPCEGFHTRGAVASPSMCHALTRNPFPTPSEVPAPAQARSVPSPPNASGSCPPHTNQMTMIPTRMFPTRHVGGVAQVFLGEPDRAPPQFHTNNPSRPHSVPPLQVRYPHLLMPARVRSLHGLYLPSGSRPIRLRRW